MTAGAIEAIAAHASADLKERYLPMLISGEWSGTMNLTEPRAGSDLSHLRCKSRRADDGTYRITGNKIYITYGEHDCASNIVHLVLARLEDAPAGTRGISLFLVPKILPDGRNNDLRCLSLEHKLGIHGSPICAMVYGDNEGATGLRLLESSRLGLARVSGEASASQMVPAVGEMARTISEVPGSPASLAAATPFLRALATTIAGGYLAETAELARGGELEREAENNARYFITVEVPSAIRAASSAVSGAAMVVNAKWSW